MAVSAAWCTHLRVDAVGDLAVRRGALSLRRGRTDDWCVTHRGSSQVAERVVVCALPLSATNPEPNGCFGSPVPVRASPPCLAQGDVLVEVVAEWGASRVVEECRKPETGEVWGLVHLDKGAAGLVEKVSR